MGVIHEGRGRMRGSRARLGTVELVETRHELVHDVDHGGLLTRLREMLSGSNGLQHWLRYC